MRLPSVICETCGKPYDPKVVQRGECAYCLMERGIRLMHGAKIGPGEAGCYLKLAFERVYGKGKEQ